MSTNSKLPPTERDFEIYDAIHIAGSSTRCQAQLHHISQTRVRQIVRRVVEWLGEVLPPQTKVAKEQETHLARQIAADRFQRQLDQMTALWDATQDAKYAGIRIRLTTAQARLGVVGGLIDGLAADALTASGGRQPTEAESSVIDLPSSTKSAPPPTRDCSLSPSPSAAIQAECSTAPTSTPSAARPSDTTTPIAHHVRRAFLAPAHHPNQVGDDPTVTELKITPQTLGFTPPNSLSRRDRRRQRRLTKSK